MSYLPSEIWLDIITHLAFSPAFLWCSLRNTNRQIRDCVEQHTKNNLVPHLRLSLTFGIPSYDARHPLKGVAYFHFLRWTDSDQPPNWGAERSGGADANRAIFHIANVVPPHNQQQFLVRWERFEDTGLPRGLEWEMYMSGPYRGEAGGMGARVHPMGAVAFKGSVEEDEGECGGRLMEFEWRETVGRFLSECR